MVRAYSKLIPTICVMAFAPVAVMAQGSIFGEVSNSDLGIPPNNTVLFFGFTNDSDAEIHVSGSIGVDYDGGYWYDDFQNFTTNTMGLPYSYFFFDTLAHEGAILSKNIPDGSYQRENIELAPVNWPKRPNNVVARRAEDGSVTISWDTDDDVKWHLFRRSGSSDGSLFRIDDPMGRLSNQGLAVPHFTQSDPGDEDSYTYLVIAEDNDGHYSPPSEPADVNMFSCCMGKVGDVNQIGGDEPTLGDIGMYIDFFFITGRPLPCLSEADCNLSGGIDPKVDDLSLGDLMMIVDYLFITETPLPQCLEQAP